MRAQVPRVSMAQHGQEDIARIPHVLGARSICGMSWRAQGKQNLPLGIRQGAGVSFVSPHDLHPKSFGNTLSGLQALAVQPSVGPTTGPLHPGSAHGQRGESVLSVVPSRGQIPPGSIHARDPEDGAVDAAVILGWRVPGLIPRAKGGPSVARPGHRERAAGGERVMGGVCLVAQIMMATSMGPYNPLFDDRLSVPSCLPHEPWDIMATEVFGGTIIIVPGMQPSPVGAFHCRRHQMHRQCRCRAIQGPGRSQAACTEYSVCQLRSQGQPHLL